ncbi:Protein CBG15115 [Caenorhabditis briggsae]|uniref:Protein CBG15115 n=1 Tax=Caenorhabditis briggsae TaxID=6238 RepID=A8XLG0_CAEBR|nr:Protein CBG15115 [Caenorhabditis briggsae]CAP33625.1 Protein CBG15115 [Caenorhabditis briggsae]
MDRRRSRETDNVSNPITLKHSNRAANADVFDEMLLTQLRESRLEQEKGREQVQCETRGDERHRARSVKSQKKEEAPKEGITEKASETQPARIAEKLEDSENGIFRVVEVFEDRNCRCSASAEGVQIFRGF